MAGTGKLSSLMWGVLPPGELGFFLKNLDLSFSRLKRDLQVTTGTFGILESPDAHQRPTSIFLSVERESPYVPAPKLFWKVVFDPTTGQSAAFMGLNDPHATAAPKNICKNRFSKTLFQAKKDFPRCSEMSSWLHFDFDDLDSGYIYCCSVPDAHRTIKVSFSF